MFHQCLAGRANDRCISFEKYLDAAKGRKRNDDSKRSPKRKFAKPKDVRRETVNLKRLWGKRYPNKDGCSDS